MTDLPELAAHLGYRLRQVSNHVSHAFARKLAARDVTVAEWVVLRALHGQEPTAPSTLADRLGLTRGAITRLADRLIGKGWAVRRPSAGDARAQTLALTAAGASLVPDLSALADRNEAECFAGLSEADREALERILTAMIGRLGLTTSPTD